MGASFSACYAPRLMKGIAVTRHRPRPDRPRARLGRREGHRIVADIAEVAPQRWVMNTPKGMLRKALLDAIGHYIADGYRREHDQIGDKGIAALARWLDEHGRQIVPKEPTAAMMKAGRDTGIETVESEAYLEEAYAAMLAAAPKLE